MAHFNKPCSYSCYFIVTTLQLRPMQGVFSYAISIYPFKLYSSARASTAASSSPIQRIQMWYMWRPMIKLVD